MYLISKRLYLILLFSFPLFCGSESNPSIQYLFPKPGSAYLPVGTEILVRFQNVRLDQISNLPAGAFPNTMPDRGGIRVSARSPKPGLNHEVNLKASLVLPDTSDGYHETSLLSEESVNLSPFIEVVGEKSGQIPVSITVLSDQKTIRILPDRPFQSGELVSVSLLPRLHEGSRPFVNKSYTFKVYDQPESMREKSAWENIPDLRPVFDYTANKTMDPLIINGISVPHNFPKMRILSSDNPSEGFIFINHGRKEPNEFHMILDNGGAPLWYRLSSHYDPRNFNLHAGGQIALNVNRPGSFGEGYYTLDNTYTVTDSFWVDWNGYKLDDHEFLLLEDGRYFLIGYKRYVIDMSDHIAVGRNNVNVRETAIFGYPAESRVPNFIWRAFDHFNVEDTDDPSLDDLNANTIRFPHMNAIKVDMDGHILLSSRHLSEITKINIETGEKIWRLGGKHNQFTFINDDLNGPANQHDIQPLGDNHYTVFDNGNQHMPPASRAVEWELNTDNMTARLVWEFRNREANGNFSYYMGNHQSLSNGNRLINWAASDGLSKLATEVTPEGEKVLEFEFEDDDDVYRIFKYPWQGVAKVPYLILEVYSDAATLIFNKFGDPDVDHYNIYGGPEPDPDRIITTSEKPFIHLAAELVNHQVNHFRVTAVDQSGQESGFSNQESALIRIIRPGDNMVVNGDFENGFEHWDWQVSDANSDWEITDAGELHFVIQDGGDADWNVQALYPGISLLNGRSYLFEFDAFADASRVVFFDVRKDGDPWTNFSKTGGTLLTTTSTHYAYPFTMEDPSEAQARIVLNVGGNDHAVTVDNVSLTRVETNQTDRTSFLPSECWLGQNYPNPFNPATSIQYTLSVSGFVSLKIYNPAGQEIETLAHEFQTAGEHVLTWQPKNLASGIYLYRLKTANFSKTRKLLLQK